VTLGCAAEKAMLLLIAAYTDALPSARATKFKEKTVGKMIKRQVEEFDKALKGHLLTLLPGDLTENLETGLNGIFALIRNTRNEAGHPTGVKLEREEVYGTLTLFPSYVKKVYALIAWLQENAPLN
jgi:hypothetical protein